MLVHGAAEFDTAATMLSRPGVLTAIVLGSVVAGVLAWLLAGRLGWSRPASALAACGLVVALAVTIARPGVLDTTDPHASALRACIRTPFSLSSTQEKLNFAMLMPFAFFGTVATRRPFVLMIGCAVVSGGIEAFQAVSEIGVCETNDFYTNTLGGVLAALAGWVCAAAFGTGRSVHRA